MTMAKDNKTLHLVLKRKWWNIVNEGLVAIGLMSLVYSTVLCYYIIRELRG